MVSLLPRPVEVAVAEAVVDVAVANSTRPVPKSLMLN